jgi:hypothetical protein
MFSNQGAGATVGELEGYDDFVSPWTFKGAYAGMVVTLVGIVVDLGSNVI